MCLNNFFSSFFTAASVLRMLHHSFGNDVFVQSLRDYLDENRFKNVQANNLFDCIDSYVARNKVKIPGGLKASVKSVLESWISQPGYPVVNATRSGSVVTLSQVM